MLLGLPEDPGDAAKALQYIRSQPNITVEEVETMLEIFIRSPSGRNTEAFCWTAPLIR